MTEEQKEIVDKAGGSLPSIDSHPAVLAQQLIGESQARRHFTPNDSAAPEVVPEAPKEASCQQSPFVRIALDIGNLTAEKNAAYGDSFSKCGDFLRILYPNGVPPEKYADMLCQVRIFDKLMRIATDKSAMGESPYRDIAGYGILGAAKDADGVKSGAEKIAE